MPEVELRIAAPADAGLVGLLLCEFNTEFGAPMPTAQEFAVRFVRLLGLPEVIVVLADRPGPVGFAYLTLRPTPYSDGPLAQLEELYVRPDVRGRGIGSELLQFALRLCRDRGALEMHITVDGPDVDAQRFYERHGFSGVTPGTDEKMLFYEQEL